MKSREAVAKRKLIYASTDKQEEDDEDLFDQFDDNFEVQIPEIPEDDEDEEVHVEIQTQRHVTETLLANQRTLTSGKYLQYKNVNSLTVNFSSKFMSNHIYIYSISNFRRNPSTSSKTGKSTTYPVS